MNKETEEVYEFMFKDKIVNAISLTKEFIQEREREKSSLGNSLEEGQQLLPFMVQKNVSDNNSETNLEMNLHFFMYPKELELLARRYSYIWTIQGMPVMKLRESGGS